MIHHDEVLKIARLARIRVTDSEVTQFQKKLQSIFGLIEKMQAIDTTGVIPMSHSQEMVLRLRTDCVTEADQRDAFQKNAPQAEAGLYLVPQVME